jgi:predicted alpha/beta superfamily hydrolase
MFVTHEIPSLYLDTTRRITVWLPPGFKRRVRRTRYPILYLNDGQNLFDPARAFAGQTWRVAETAEYLVRRRRIPPVLIVGIDHGEVRRAREYLPVEDDRNPFARRPLGREYAEFVTGEVMPFIVGNYPVARRASRVGFGGSSYGAIAALYTALLKPGIFGRLLLESPSLYVGRGYLLRLARSAKRWPSRVYLGVGTRETRREEVNRRTVRDVLLLERALKRARRGPSKVRVSIEAGAAHTESAWADRLPDALEFLFGR